MKIIAVNQEVPDAEAASQVLRNIADQLDAGYTQGLFWDLKDGEG